MSNKCVWKFVRLQFRLKQCGLENKIYLVEHKKNIHGLPISNLLQALANTEIVDGFTVVRTENHLESMKYIANFSHQLTNMYKVKIIIRPDQYIFEININFKLFTRIKF